jgi:hypothetical protein
MRDIQPHHKSLEYVSARSEGKMLGARDLNRVPLAFVAVGAFNLILSNHAKASSIAAATGYTLCNPYASLRNQCCLVGFVYCAEKANDVRGGDCA